MTGAAEPLVTVTGYGASRVWVCWVSFWGWVMEGWEYVTREEVEEMISEAIRRHNRNAGIISAIVGWSVLSFFADGVWRAFVRG